MFSLIKVGDTAVVDGQVYEVVRVSMSRFWLLIDGQLVKFTKKNGIEYGAGRDRLARPVDELPAPEQRTTNRRLAIGDLPEEQFAWLMAVDACLGPGRTVMDAIHAGWDWQTIYADYSAAPDLASLSAFGFLM